MTNQEQIAIGFIVRDKFSRALESLTAIYTHSRRPFTLYFVNTGYPEEVLRDLRGFLADKDNVIEIPTGGYVLANGSLNLVIERLEEPYLCVVENDVIVGPGYIEGLLEPVKEFGADIVSPIIIEGEGDDIHYDPPYSVIEKEEDGYISKVVRNPREGYPQVYGIRKIYHIEKHCFFMSNVAAKSLFPFEAHLTTRSHHDMALRAFEAGLETYMAPDAKVRFLPEPLLASDIDYFAWRWDVDRGKASNEYVQSKWNIKGYKSTDHFVEEQQELLRRYVPDPTAN